MFVIQDGYTLPFATDADVPSIAGPPVYTGLPIISGFYRPPTWEERAAFDYRTARAVDDEEYIKTVSEWVAGRIASWDVKIKTPNADPLPAPHDAATLRKVPEPIFNMIFNAVSKWGARAQEDAGKN